MPTFSRFTCCSSTFWTQAINWASLRKSATTEIITKLEIKTCYCKNLYLNQAAVAQLVGMLKDNFERDQIESPITAHPNFEKLEAVGSLLT